MSIQAISDSRCDGKNCGERLDDGSVCYCGSCYRELQNQIDELTAEIENLQAEIDKLKNEE